MPEGDSVWKLARRLDRQLSGRRVVSSDFRTPRLATRDLAGRELLGHDFWLQDAERTYACVRDVVLGGPRT